METDVRLPLAILLIASQFTRYESRQIQLDISVQIGLHQVGYDRIGHLLGRSCRLTRKEVVSTVHSNVGVPTKQKNKTVNWCAFESLSFCDSVWFGSQQYDGNVPGRRIDVLLCLVRI